MADDQSINSNAVAASIPARPSTQLLKYFTYSHLPPHLQAVSKPIGDLATLLDHQLPDGPEKTTGLRKLLEAKDCFVRAALDTK